MRRLTSIGCFSTSKPATSAEPVEGGRKQVSTRIVVVLPAPLGPRKPTIWPFSTSKEMLSTATLRAYRFVSPSTLIIRKYSRRAECSFVSVEHYIIRGTPRECQSRLPTSSETRTEGRQKKCSRYNCGARFSVPQRA